MHVTKHYDQNPQLTFHIIPLVIFFIHKEIGANALLGFKVNHGRANPEQNYPLQQMYKGKLKRLKDKTSGSERIKDNIPI